MSRTNGPRVARDTVVTLEYTLTAAGEKMDASPEGEPVFVLLGHEPLPAGLEEAVSGLLPGPFELSVPPKRAYGEYDPGRVTLADRSDFPPDAEIRVGAEFYAYDESGAPVAARVTAAEGDRITVDTNPRLAGKTLRYTGVIHAVRAATASEIDHGHVHAGGVCH
jgi:FKBP-type peptidyl-prolyl cis-trans isomerase SlyD